MYTSATSVAIWTQHFSPEVKVTSHPVDDFLHYLNQYTLYPKGLEYTKKKFAKKNLGGKGLRMQDLTNITAHFLKQPSETRWIAIKYVAVHVLDQYPNIKEYFLKFLSKQKTFRSTVEKTDRYKQICKNLNDP